MICYLREINNVLNKFKSKSCLKYIEKKIKEIENINSTKDDFNYNIKYLLMKINNNVFLNKKSLKDIIIDEMNDEMKQKIIDSETETETETESESESESESETEDKTDDKKDDNNNNGGKKV